LSTGWSRRKTRSQKIAARLYICTLRDRHRLYIHELADAVGGEFAAVAGLFDAAEGDSRIRGDHLVDEDHARFEFVDEALAFAVVFRPGAGAEAEAAVVGEADGFINVLNPE